MLIMIKYKIKTISNGFLYFLIVEIISKLLLLDFIKIKNGGRYSHFRKKILLIRYLTRYSHYFKKLHLQKAYRARLENVLAIDFGLLDGDRKAARDYLSLMKETNFLQSIHLKQSYFQYIMMDVKDLVISPLPDATIKNLGRVLLCGPAQNINTIDFSCYDHVVFNKLPPESINLKSEKIILILNNRWTIEKREEITKWHKRNEKAQIISPQQISEVIVRHNVFDSIPKFPLGASLMGLQRAMFILKKLFNIDRLDVFGYNFSLTNMPYSSWYSSLLEKDHGSQRKGIITTNMIHDLLLNYSFTKKFIKENAYIKGPIIKICEAHYNDFLSKFSQIYQTGN